MSNILVIGGGFAGVWSAAAAARLSREHGSDHRVTLLAPNDRLTIRPRLYEADPGTMRVPLDRVLDPIGVRRVRAGATAVDTTRRLVETTEADGGDASRIAYDRLVLATGSRLIRPSFPGAELLHDVDTLDAAVALDEHIHRLPREPRTPGRFTAVVVGAGFTGLEVATELVDRLRAIAAEEGVRDEVRVVLVQRGEVIGETLGEAARPTITRALDRLAVERRLRVTVERLDRDGVRLSDGSRIEARTVVWTAGMAASPLTEQIPADRDALGRLPVDRYLRVSGVPGVYAAGDTAAAVVEGGNTVPQSCQYAGPLGKFAGHNAAADLLGVAPVPFEPEPYTTTLDLGSAGAVATVGFERALREAPDGYVKKLKHQINSVWIYPPVDDAEEILRVAHYSVTQRQPVPE